MQQCLIYNNSLRFFRATYGILALVAFLIQNHWLVLAISLLMAFGVFSIKFNIPYQFHALILRKLLKERSEPIQRESGELNFVSGMTGSLLFIGFLFLYFGKFVSFVWIYVLMITAFMLLGGFTDFCLATAMYIFFKKIFKSK